MYYQLLFKQTKSNAIDMRCRAIFSDLKTFHSVNTLCFYVPTSLHLGYNKTHGQWGQSKVLRSEIFREAPVDIASLAIPTFDLIAGL